MLEFLSKLRVDSPLCVSIVGAGGKTTLLSLLAKQLHGRNICTTTTKLACQEASLFSRHLDLRSQFFDPTQLRYLERDLLITNGPTQKGRENKLQGLNEAQLNQVWKYCQDSCANLLIEADGAKRKLLKAPADWEPVIPEFTDLVICVFCPDILGQSLNEDNVFRSQLFAGVTGSNLGEVIDGKMLTRYLIHPQGGFKNIPDQARKILFSNSHGSGFMESAFGDEEIQTLATHFDHFFEGNLKQDGLLARQVF